MYPTNSNVVWRGGLPPVFSVVVWPMDDMGRKRPRYYRSWSGTSTLSIKFVPSPRDYGTIPAGYRAIHLKAARANTSCH